MTAGFRTCCFQLFRAAAISVTTLTACSAQAQPVATMPHVRSEDPAIAALIADAEVLSPTFRKLVLDIETTNGIVYVEAGQCGFGVQACLMHSVVVAGPHRLLRIVVNTRRDRAGLIGAIGHELQHAWEMLSVPGLTTSHAMFYRALGTAQSATTRFETDEAVKVGLRIADEVRRKARDSESIPRAGRLTHKR